RGGPIGTRDVFLLFFPPLHAAASILSCCFLWTQAQAKTGIPIKVEPEILQEGQSVTLTPGDIDVTTLRSCKWYRGSSADGNRIFTYFLAPVISQKNGSAFTDRETGRRDCSLRITDLTPSDSGTYTLEPEGPLEHRIGAINITVPGMMSLRRFRFRY
uniref:Immunoglobulin domain-containing protein n=1 Tax=Podarcis muralis TaxID=64176 RepID=A0A670ISY4_PODMU